MSQESRRRNLPFQRRMQPKKPTRLWRRKSGWFLLALLIIVAIFGILHVAWQPSANNSSSSKSIALVFAGTPITEQQIDVVKVQHAQALLKNSQSFQPPSKFSDQALNDYALYSVFDKIEEQKQSAYYKVTSVDALTENIVPRQVIDTNAAHVFYKNHPLFFMQSSPQIHVREIVVQDQHLAQWISQQLLKGTSFSQLALKYSVDPQNYRSQGGDLGWIRPGQTSEKWDSVVFSLHSNQTSNVFQIGNLYFIVQMLEGPSYDTIPYNDVSPPVPIIATQYFQQQKFIEWLSAKIVDEPMTIQISTYESVVSNSIKDLHVHPDQGLSDGIHF